jgi:hypothetical protein
MGNGEVNIIAVTLSEIVDIQENRLMELIDLGGVSNLQYAIIILRVVAASKVISDNE